MQKGKLQIINKIRLNGELYLQEDFDPEEFRSLVDKKMNETMENIGFEKDKTA